MKIILIRHGKPDIPSWGKLKASELHQWIESYNSVGIKKESQPPREATEAISNCNAVVCSDLLRSIESAKALGIKKVHYTESIFREMELPYAGWSFPKLSPDTWVVIFRTLWFLGFSRNSESFSSAKLRAIGATEKLRQIAQEHGSVLLVGHGMVNRFIAKELLSSGWQGPSSPGKRYWEFGVYEYSKT